MRRFGKALAVALASLALSASAARGPAPGGIPQAPRLVPIADGWARTSVNATIFRRNSVVTQGGAQYAAFYGPDQQVMLAKRALGTAAWEVRRTQFNGRCADAHNGISIMLDGSGLLHMAWDHHSSRLRYSRGVGPGSLELTAELPMLGRDEDRVTYPEFHRLPGGDLLFAYRDGESGKGNLVLNRYDAKTARWSRLHDDLVSGEGRRNPYWQMAVGLDGAVHLSWVWRETPDVQSNHDLCYAKSVDAGRTWRRTNGEAYRLPITATTAEYAWRIPAGSDLINQTSMCADSRGRPYVATYWRPAGQASPQYFVVFHDGEVWKVVQPVRRTTPFSLKGAGTKRIPVSRPAILADATGRGAWLYLVFRDEERGNRVSVAAGNTRDERWRTIDLTQGSVGMWEPTFDTTLWAQARRLHLFVQKVGQGDAETAEDVAPQQVAILEWEPERAAR